MMFEGQSSPRKGIKDQDPRPISVIDGMFDTSEHNEVISVSKTNM